MAKESENKKILHLIQQEGTLMLMNLNHIRNLGNITFDTIASHSFHVAVIAYCIANGGLFSSNRPIRKTGGGVSW